MKTRVSMSFPLVPHLGLSHNTARMPVPSELETRSSLCKQTNTLQSVLSPEWKMLTACPEANSTPFGVY